MTDPAAPLAPSQPKSAFASIEGWGLLVLYGIIGYLATKVGADLPALLANPAIPPQALMFLPLVAPVLQTGLAGIAAWATAHVVSQRTALKLDAQKNIAAAHQQAQDIASRAVAAAQGQDPADVLAVKS